MSKRSCDHPESGSSHCLHVIEYAQAVKEIYEIVPARKWSDEENRVNKIVFIGQISFFFCIVVIIIANKTLSLCLLIHVTETCAGHKLDEEALKTGLRECRA